VWRYVDREGCGRRHDFRLIQSTVQMLVLGSGISFADRGEHTLKGVPGHWHLFAVGNY
jgi:hypothetical protein